MAPDDAVRGLAVATAMGGSLARGTCDVLDDGNGYAAAALLRQMVEVEFLWSTFADEPEDAAGWLNASRSQLESRFRPGQLRKRSTGDFERPSTKRTGDNGGHPSHSDGRS